MQVPMDTISKYSSVLVWFGSLPKYYEQVLGIIVVDLCVNIRNLHIFVILGSIYWFSHSFIFYFFSYSLFICVSRHSWLSFVFNICKKIALCLQFIVHFVGIVHIFIFSLILYNRCSHFCELMLKPLQFQAKRREGSSS